MKYPCPQCKAVFDDAEWKLLHLTAQHGRERETKQRGKGGGRKPSSHAVHNNGKWTNSAPSASTLMNHYRPKEKPKFESEPVELGPPPPTHDWFTMKSAKDRNDINAEYRRMIGPHYKRK